MVAVVNGYVCFTTCDAAKAKQGKDPNAPPGAASNASQATSSNFNHRPATMRDGVLKGAAHAVNAAGDSAATGSDDRARAIDRWA